MTKDNIIKLAREAGFMPTVLNHWPNELERFANLVAAHKAEVALAEAYRCGYEAGVAAEREACAGLLESRKTNANSLIDAVRDMEAAAIRARTTP